MKEQLNQGCFVPREFVVERIEESFLRIRKLGTCLITYLILFVLLASLSIVSWRFSLFDTGFIFFNWFIFLVFSIAPIILLIFIALRLTDVDWVLNRHDCGDTKNFEAYLRSLRNLAITCIVFWFIFPVLGIILGFILRRRMKDMRNMWMSRFNLEPTLEVTESQE